MATSQRSLRVGIVISGQLVEERLFSGTAPITVGQSLRCDLSVPADGLPREHTLFTREGQGYRVAPPPGAEVTTGMRGKVTLGEVTILFQEVAAPVRMALPPGLRLSLLDRIDRRLAVIIAGSLAAHIAIASYAWLQDAEHPVLGAPYVATTYHQEVIDVLVPDVAPSLPGAATPVTPSRPIVQPSQITSRPAQPAQPVDTQRLANILTGADGEVGKGGMNGRQPGAPLDQQIADANDKRATIGDGPTSRVDDGAHTASSDRTITADPTLTQTPRPTHAEPTGRVIPGQVEPETWTTLTPATVLDRISTLYMAGLQRCYRFGLATDSTLSGRVAISFTVDERGQVVVADASGVSPTVDGCIAKQMKSWRFPIARDKTGAATDASFSVSLALQPS